LPGLELRLGDSADPAELALRQRVLAEPLGLSLEAVRFGFEGESLRLWAFDEGSLVGCVLFHPQGDGGRLYQMAVEESRRGSGIGRALVERLHTELRARGVRRVWLNARAPVVGFYERLGYTVVGEPFVEVGIEHRRMTRAL
jgi:ribosomal protein S18 acetylase RimI-like enzyme